MGEGWWTSFTSAIAKIFKDLPQQLLWHMPMSTKRSCLGLGPPTQWAVVIEGVTSEGQLRLHSRITCVPLKKANRPSLRDTASVCLMWTFRHLFSSGCCFNILFFDDEIFQTYRETQWIHSTYPRTYHLDLATYSFALGAEKREEGKKRRREEKAGGRFKDKKGVKKGKEIPSLSV